MNFRKFMRNTKAISPIFATLILIAIAIIAGVVVYAFTSGFLSGSTGGGPVANEQISIQAAQYDGSATNTVTLYCQSQGSVTIASGFIKQAGNIVDPLDVTAFSGPIGTTLTALVVTPVTTPLPAGAYTITLITASGNQFVSPSFVVG